MAAPQKNDPNRYKKNANVEADTPLKTIMSFGGIALVIVGLVGIAFEFFKSDGFFAHAWHWLWDDMSHLWSIPIAAVILWLLNMWMSSAAIGEKKKSGDVPMYIMMALGAYYVFLFITTGSF
jgi:hypothetical protein